MAGKVKAIPDGIPWITPYLSVTDGPAAIDFYCKVFGATEIYRLADPDGRIAHAELRIGNSLIFLAGENPSWGNISPKTLGGTTVRICLAAESVDEVWKRALDAGGKGLIPPQDQFYGERSARIEDPFGHQWLVSTHIEDVTPEEMKRRMEEMMKQK
jgi:PhnB protein